MKITKTWLKEKGACRDGVEWFEGCGLEGVDRDDLLGILQVERWDWAVWLAGQAGWTGMLDYTQPDGTRDESYYERGERHREGGLPAWIVTQPNGTRYESYYERGERHREGGLPAVIDTRPNGTRDEAYYERGQRQ